MNTHARPATPDTAIAAERRPAWSAAVQAEWTKLRTLPSTAWLLAATVATTITVTAIIAAATHVNPTENPASSAQDSTKLALAGIDLSQAVIAVLAVLTVCEEYATGMIRVTLTAMPRRLVLLGAKAGNLACVTFAAGVLGVAGCLLVGRLLLPAHGYVLISITHSRTLRAGLGSVLYLALIALLALGVATAIRDTAVSIGAVLALVYLPPLLAQVVSDPLRRHIQQIAPMTAGLAIQTTTNLHDLPIAPWTGLCVLAAWAAASLVIAGVLLWHRDA